MPKFVRQGMPDHTRLRYVNAKDADDIALFLKRIQQRVEIKGNPVWDGKKWWVWFVPGDLESDIKSTEL